MTDQPDVIRDLGEIGELRDQLFPDGAQTDAADGEAEPADSSHDEVDPTQLADIDESIVGEPAPDAEDTSEEAEVELDEIYQALFPLVTAARAAFALAPPADAGDWTPEERAAFHASRDAQQDLADAIFTGGYQVSRPDGWEDDRITHELTKGPDGKPPSSSLADMLPWSREYRQMWYVRVTYHLVVDEQSVDATLRDFRYPWQPKSRSRQAVPTPPAPASSDDSSGPAEDTTHQHLLWRHPLWGTLTSGQRDVALSVASIQDALAADPSLDYAQLTTQLRELLVSEAVRRRVGTHKVQSALTYLKGVIKRRDDIVKAVAELHLWQQPAAPPRDVPTPPAPTPTGSLPIDVPLDDWPFDDVIIISGSDPTAELSGPEADRIAADTAFLLEEGTLSMTEILARVTAQP